MPATPPATSSSWNVPLDAASAQTRPDIGIPLATAQPASLWQLFVAFAIMSAKSWGGGAGTTYTMHQELVRRGWSTSAQYVLDLGLARLVPGINLLAVAVMVGYRSFGVAGAVVAQAGLLLPASLITLILTVGFVEITAHPLGKAAVQGVIPVTAALTYAMAQENARGALPWGERRAMALMALYGAIAFASVAIFHLSVVLPIIGGAIYGALLLRPPERRV